MARHGGERHNMGNFSRPLVRGGENGEGEYWPRRNRFHFGGLERNPVKDGNGEGDQL